MTPNPQVRFSRVKAALFLLLPNDWVWERLLSAADRRALLAANRAANETRADFTPELYQKGASFESDESRLTHPDGKWFVRFLETYNPVSVLECGPGSGFHTRTIVEHPSVTHYQGVEMNPVFLDYLDRMLAPYRESRGLTYRLFRGDVKEAESLPCDAVIFSLSLHHMPDRLAIFKKVAEMTRPGGRVLCVEPTHYWPRLRHLWRKVVSPGYLAGMVDGSIDCGTHHFCTWSEFRKLARATKTLAIRDVEYDGYRGAMVPRVLGKVARILGLGWPAWLRTSFPVRLFSQRMMIVFERR